MQPIKMRPHQLPAVFGPATDVVKETATLLRIVKLHSSVWEDDRKKYLNQLGEGWLGCQQRASNPKEAKAFIIEKLYRLDVHDVYGSAIEKTTTTDELNRLVNKFMKDINSIMSNPLKNSTRGQKGPTFLVGYSRLDKFNNPQLNCHVIKWTHWNELCCTRIYSVFSGFLNSSSFSVPNVCGFDFEKNIHELYDATQTEMDPQENQKIMRTFEEIAKIGAPSHKLADKLIMLCERINGENLFDFALTKYEYLPQGEKVRLLTQLGKIAMLDLLTGNLDRIVQIWFNWRIDSYVLLDCEANLGNIMVRWIVGEEKKPVLYAIDNGIQTELVEDAEHIKKYQTFLNALFSDPQMKSKLVSNIVQSFKHALVTQGDDLSTQNTGQLRAKLKAFSDDIQTLGPQCFGDGLEEMSSLLQSTLLPKWNGEQGEPWRNYLSTTYPKLLDAIQFRFNEFTTKRTS